MPISLRVSADVNRYFKVDKETSDFHTGVGGEWRALLPINQLSWVSSLLFSLLRKVFLMRIYFYFDAVLYLQ